MNMVVARLKPWLDYAGCAALVRASEATMARARATYEETLRSRLGAGRVYALSSARAALALALELLGIGRGDEVVIPALTCSAVADAVLARGGIPHLVDVSPRHFGLDVHSLARVLARGRTRAAVTAPLFGGCPPQREVETLLAQRRIPHIEDAAQSFGSLRAGRPAGAGAAIAVISTNFDKPITTGRGGALVVNDPALAERADATIAALAEQSRGEAEAIFKGLVIGATLFGRRTYEPFQSVDLPFLYAEAEGDGYDLRALLDHGADNAARRCRGAGGRLMPDVKAAFFKRAWRWLYPRSAVPALGGVRRLSPLLAAVGSRHLLSLDAEGVRRRQLAARFDAAFDDESGVRGPWWGEGDDVTWPIRYPAFVRDGVKRDAVVARLLAAGYEAGPFIYPRPLSGTFPYYKLARRSGRSLRGAWRAASSLVNLPLHAEVEADDVDRMIEAVSA